MIHLFSKTLIQHLRSKAEKHPGLMGKPSQGKHTQTSKLTSKDNLVSNLPILHVFGLSGKPERSEKTHKHANSTQKGLLATY